MFACGTRSHRPVLLCFSKYEIKVKSWLHERAKTSSLLLLGATFICMSVRDFVVCQQHNQLHSSCSNCFSDAGQGIRMILSATKGTSFHLTTCSWYCSLPSSLFSRASFPLCWQSGCFAFLLSLPCDALRRRNVAQPCVTCT